MLTPAHVVGSWNLHGRTAPVRTGQLSRSNWLRRSHATNPDVSPLAVSGGASSTRPLERRSGPCRPAVRVVPAPASRRPGRMDGSRPVVLSLPRQGPGRGGRSFSVRCTCSTSSARISGCLGQVTSSSNPSLVAAFAQRLPLVEELRREVRRAERNRLLVMTGLNGSAWPRCFRNCAGEHHEGRATGNSGVLPEGRSNQSDG